MTSHKENFDTLMAQRDVEGILKLAKLYPEKKCSPKVLDWASTEGYTEVVKILVKLKKPCTTLALERASMYGHTEIVIFLLDAGSPYSDCTVWAIDCASGHGNMEIVKLLLKGDKLYSEEALKWAARNGYSDIVDLLVTASKFCTGTPWQTDWLAT